VGLLDQHSYDVQFFTEFERFDRHVEKLRRGPSENRIDYVSICAPNHLHDAHVRFALRAGADAICEKPLVLNPWNCDALQELEAEYGRRVYTVLQLRLHPALIALKEGLAQPPGHALAGGVTSGSLAGGGKHDVDLTYVTSRGPWYLASWKGNPEKSGGLATNIGIHFFDMLLWLFGGVESSEVYEATPMRTSGCLELCRAHVQWFLSIDRNDLPDAVRTAGRPTFRRIAIDGRELEFSENFTDLHTRVYEEVLAGRGFGIDVVRPSIQLAHDIRHAAPTGRPCQGAGRRGDAETRRRGDSAE
jgi:UDP-N-acetyl-2-amino-2-deoxyglucuronate dehydrogenase